MSGTTRPVKLRVEAEEVNRARQDLERLGADGDRALKRIGTASVAAQPGIQGLAAASDGAVRAFGNLGVSAGGLERVFAGVGSGASGAAAGMAAIGAAALAAGVGIARAGDEYVGVVSRLTSATGSLQGAQRAYEGLFKLSQQTGASVAESAGAFSRLAVAAKEIGATNDQVLKLVAGIQKAGIVAGTSAEEAGAAVQQLGQALASGVLQGDELRSLLENMPQLAQALAKELGVGIGQLRQMGAEGKLTADKVFPALLAASEKMNAEFEKMPPTMGRAFGILGAAMQDFASRLDQALGLSQAIAAAAIAAAEAVNKVKQGVVPTRREALEREAALARQQVEYLERNSTGAQAALDRLMAGGRTEEQARAMLRAATGSGGNPLERSIPSEQQIAEAKARLSRAYVELRELNNDEQEAAAAERDKANIKRAQNEREAADKRAKALMEANSEEYKAETKHQQNLRDLRKSFEEGGLSSSEYDLAVSNATKKHAEEMKKLAEAAKGATEAVKGLMEVWATPQLNFKTGLLSFSEGDNRFQEQVKKNLARAAEEAKKADADRTKEAEREAEKIADRNQKITDDIVQYASERFGDLFSDTGRGWAGLMDSMKKTAISTFGRIVAEAALRPIVQPIIGAFLGTTGGGGGSLAGIGGGGGGGILSSLGSLGNLSSVGGLFGSGGGISSFLSTPLWGADIAGPVTASGIAASGAPTLGAAFGGIGAGFGAGTLLNGLVGGNQLGGMIGSGLGSVAGFLVGGPLGALIGGAGGGLIGGLFGPGPKHHGWSYTLDANTPNGLLDVKWPAIDEVAQQQFAQESQQIAQINAFLKANKLSASGVYVVGGNNGGQYGEYDSLAAGFSNLRFSAANDDNLNSALSGRMFSGADQLADFVGVVRDLIPALSAAPTSEYANALKALNATYDAAIDKAQEYALAEEGLATERDRRIAELSAQRDLRAAGITSALTVRYDRATGLNQEADLLAFDQAAAEERVQLRQQIDALGLAGTQYAAERIVQIEQTLAAERLAIVEKYATDSRSAGQSLLLQLAIGSGSALAPEQQYFAGLSVLNSARARLEAGGALSDFTSVASQILPVARDFLGTSERYAALVADIAGVVGSRGGDPAGLSALLQAQVNGTDALRDVFASYGQQQLGVASATLSEIRRLASSLEAYIARQTAA